MTDSLYNFDRRLKQVTQRVRESTEISPVNRRLILKYIDEMLSLGLSDGRVSRLTYFLTKLEAWLGCDFPDADIARIKRVVARIHASPYAPYSKKIYKLLLRRFYKWLRGTDEYPPEVKWIPTSLSRQHEAKLPEQLLTESDVQALVKAALTPRDRAFVSVLYETGARIGELASRRVRHVTFDQYGAKILLDGKTGARSVRIVASAPALKAWVNVHPRGDAPDAYLWPAMTGGFCGYSAICELLRRLADRAGVRKPVNPHTFRHSRATHLASHLTEAQMKSYFGWVQGSDMAAVYVHLSGRDVDDAVLRLHGLKKESETKGSAVLTPKRCRQCNTENPSANRFCSLCGLPLDEKACLAVVQDDFRSNEADDILDRMLEDREFKKHFVRRLQGVAKQMAT